MNTDNTQHVPLAQRVAALETAMAKIVEALDAYKAERMQTATDVATVQLMTRVHDALASTGVHEPRFPMRPHDSSRGGRDSRDSRGGRGAREGHRGRGGGQQGGRGGGQRDSSGPPVSSIGQVPIEDWL